MVADTILTCGRPEIDNVGVIPESENPGFWQAFREKFFWPKHVTFPPSTLTASCKAMYKDKTAYG